MPNILQNCTCGNVSYGIMGRPTCVTTMEDVYTFIFAPRYDASNDQNEIDVSSATLGVNFKALIQQAAPDAERIYPLPRVYDFDSSNTEAKYDTTTDDTKFKLSKVGEVYTWTGKLKDKDAAFRAYNEIDKNGCGETDVWVVDKSYTIWGAMDDFTSTMVRGIHISSASFMASYEFATAARTNGIPFAFDLESKDEIKKMVGITQEEHGLSAADFKPLIPIDTALTAVSSTVISMQVVNPYAKITGNGFIGLVNSEISFEDTTAGAAVAGATVEVGNGLYTFTAGAAMTAGNTIENAIVPASLTGYFFNPSTVVAIS